MAGFSKSRQRRLRPALGTPRLSTATFLVLLSAAARTGVVAASLLGRDSLLFVHRSTAAADELKIGEFLVLFPLYRAGKIRDRGLRGPLLFLGDSDRLFNLVVNLLLRFLFRERHNRTRGHSIFARFVPSGDLQEEQITDALVLDPVHHVLEQRERFFLVFDQRILLSVAAQSDTFLEVIHRQQMVFPLVVDDVEHDDALGLAQVIRADQLFFFLITLFQQIGDFVFNLGASEATEVGQRNLQTELRQDIRLQADQIVSARDFFFGATDVDIAGDDALYNLVQTRPLILTFQQLAAHAVNRLPLLVHHVVVLKQVFAGGEVLRFHRLLRSGDPLAD